MDVTAYLVWAAVPAYLAGLAHLALATWIYVLAPRAQTHRAFALYLFLWGLADMLIGLQFALLGTWQDQVLHHTEVILLIGALAPLLWFLLVYPRPRVDAARRRLILTLAGLYTAVVLAMIVSADRLVAEWGTTDGPVVSGFYVAGALTIAGVSVGAWWLAREIPNAKGSDQRHSLRLVVLGFTLYGLYRPVRAATILWAPQLSNSRTSSRLFHDTVPGMWFEAIISAAGLFALAAVWHLVKDRPRGSRSGLMTLFAAAVLLGVATGLDAVPRAITVATVQMAPPILVTYALLRHRLFGIDIKVKWTIKQSTMAAIFIGLFFIVSESAAAFFSDRIGTYLGIVAAGTLVFAIAPLQHFAQRVADHAMPDVQNTDEYWIMRKGAIYRATVEEMLTDGDVTAKERRALARLQQQLGLDPNVAKRLETDVLEARGDA